MFSLLIVLISIVLVGLLAAATIFYGGNSTQTAAARASAATLINQAVQIAAAGDLTNANGQEWPTTLSEFPTDMLASMPVPPKNAYQSGLIPSQADWAYYVPSSHHFVLRNKINKDVCFAVNKSQGLIGIPATLTSGAMIQCFGVSEPYTFYYDPPGTTATQTATTVAQSVGDANTVMSGNPILVVPSDGPTDAGQGTSVSTVSTPGFPVLCPSGNNINTGSCLAVPGGPSVPPPSSIGLVMSCSGTSEALIISADCTVTNNSSNPVLGQDFVFTSPATGPIALDYANCYDLMAPGASCSFHSNAIPPTNVPQPVMLQGSFTTGPDGTGSNVVINSPSLQVVEPGGVASITPPADGYVIRLGQTTTLPVYGKGFAGKGITAVGVYVGYPIQIETETVSDTLLAVTIHGESATDSQGRFMNVPFMMHFTEGVAPYTQAYTRVTPILDRSLEGNYSVPAGHIPGSVATIVVPSHTIGVSAKYDNYTGIQPNTVGGYLYVNLVGGIPAALHVYNNDYPTTFAPVPFTIYTAANGSSYAKIDLRNGCHNLALYSDTVSKYGNYQKDFNTGLGYDYLEVTPSCTDIDASLLDKYLLKTPVFTPEY